MATFDLWQQAYVLSQQSGSVSARQGTPSELASALDKLLNEFYAQAETVSAIGKWSTVWGPLVFESNPGPTSYADNVMFAAANADRSAYLVGIAGTNPNSKYDIDQEDLAVGTTEAWISAFPSLQPYSVPGGLNPYLSTGTALGVNNLLGMVDTMQGTNQTLAAFLQSLPSATTRQATLIFAGHSLGGALSPPLALAFFNPDGGKLSSSAWANVYVYPTAGPTPGNADFGRYLSSVFPPTSPGKQPYQVWNRNVMNTLDVIPHAWEISTLDQIAGLYSPYDTQFGTPPLKVLGGVQYAKGLSNKGGSTEAGPYEQIESQPLPGTFQGSKRVADFSDFAAQTLYQHTTAYDVLLNVTSLSPGARNQAAYVPVVRAMLSAPEGTSPVGTA
ncbi:MAG TPA: hypothetical protein VGH73_16305 [Thermoanaerobaculia bacterium]|jgi:hypothetical protein